MLIDSAKIRHSPFDAEPTASETVESPALTLRSASALATTNCEAVELQKNCGDHTNADTNMDSAAQANIESPFPTSEGSPHPETAHNDSDDSNLSCGEPTIADTDMSSQFVALEKQGG